MQPWDVFEVARRIVARHLDTDDLDFVAAQLIAEYGAQVLDESQDWGPRVLAAQEEVIRYAQSHNYYAPWNPYDEADWACLEEWILETLPKGGESR
jgi:hypothetical protein